MPFSVYHLLGHCVCTIGFAIVAVVCKTHRRWIILFAGLFLVSPPAVYLIWGPFRYYPLYIATFLGFFLLTKGVERFYLFLKTQEKFIRNIFWSAVFVFAAAIISSTVNEINIRRDALTFWNHELQLHPDSQTMENLADANLEAKNFSKAQWFYNQAISLDPKSVRAYQGLIVVAKHDKDWDKVIEEAQKIIQLDLSLAQPFLDLAQAYRFLGKSSLAVETYSNLLIKFPDNESVYIKVIEAYGQAVKDNPQDELYKEKREDVLADFEQLSKRKNYNAGDYYNLAFLYDQVGGKEEAMRYYTKAIDMQPNHKEALTNLANLYRDAGNLKAAMIFYVRLVHFYPKSVVGYLNIGKIFSAFGDANRANQLFLKVIQLDPNNGDAYFNLGYLSESQGELNEAVNYYEKAVELSPKNAEAYYNLGNVYASLGQNAEAIAAYLKSVAIDPKHQDAFVNLSILSFKSRDFQGAIHYLEDAQNLGYNPPDEYLRTLEPYRK